MQENTVTPVPEKLAVPLRSLFYKYHLKKGSEYLEDVWLDDFFIQQSEECSRNLYPASIETDENGVILSVSQRMDVMDSGGRVIAQYESRFTPETTGKTYKSCTVDSLGFKAQTETPNGNMWKSIMSPEFPETKTGTCK
jgi:hypothetical protein